MTQQNKNIQKYMRSYQKSCGLHQEAVAFTRKLWPSTGSCGLHQEAVAFTRKL